MLTTIQVLAGCLILASGVILQRKLRRAKLQQQSLRLLRVKR